MPQSLRVLLFSLMVFNAGLLQAGVVTLSNGDRITGELIEIVDGRVRWRSTLMGEVSFPQVNVSSIQTRKLYHVQLGREQRLSGCLLQWQSQQGRQLLNCQEGIVELPDWQLVARVSELPLFEREQWQSTGFVTASAKDSSGNTEQETYAVDARVELRRGDHRHTVVAEYDVERNEETKTKDQRKLSYQYDLFVSDRVFLNGRLAHERNEFKDLRSRDTVGAGVGYQFFDTELAALSVATGLVWLREDFRVDTDREALAFRLNTDFRWLLTGFGLEFFHRNTLLQSMDQGADWEFESDTGFKLPLVGSLSSEVKLEYDYDNTPSEDAVKEDRVWSVGLSYDW